MYMIRCPQCDCSDLEKLDSNFIGFKCLDCGYEFSATESTFYKIDDYQVYEPIEIFPQIISK